VVFPLAQTAYREEQTVETGLMKSVFGRDQTYCHAVRVALIPDIDFGLRDLQQLIFFPL
jgi:hypothetical protein